jgi:hypothetical protein
MLEHLPEKFFSEDLIHAHLQSEVGRGKLKSRTEEMMKALQRTNPALANSIAAAVSTAPSGDAKDGFLSGAFYILSLLDQKFSAENLGKAFNV